MLKFLLVVMFVMGIASIAEARDVGEVAETVFDTLTGQNDSCPMNVSGTLAKRWVDKVGKADVIVGLNYTGNIRSLTDNNSVTAEFTLEW